MTLDGGAGDDTVFSGSGADVVIGGDDNDIVNGGTGNDSLFGGAGNDNLNGSGGDDSLQGEDGIDTVKGGSGNDSLSGGAGNDVIDGQGSSGDRLVEQGDVDFTLTSTTLTGLGTDSLTSIEQAYLTGGDGANELNASGVTIPVTLLGGAGDDILTGGTLGDYIGGGDGTDEVRQTVGSQTLTDSSLTGAGTDTLSSIEQASLGGGSGNDTIDASTFSGSVTIVGGAGNDVLTGGYGEDNIRGDAGIDTLVGGDGFDLVDGLPDGFSADVNGDESWTVLVSNGAEFTAGVWSSTTIKRNSPVSSDRERDKNEYLPAGDAVPGQKRLRSDYGIADLENTCDAAEFK